MAPGRWVDGTSASPDSLPLQPTRLLRCSGWVHGPSCPAPWVLLPAYHMRCSETIDAFLDNSTDTN